MKRFLIPMFFMILLISQTVYADNEISVNITQERKNVIVSGELEGVTGFHEVTVLIGGVDNALYAKQVMTDENGGFSVVAVMPDNAEVGEYTYIVSTSADLPMVQGTFMYTFEIDSSLRFEGMNVTITGDHSGLDGTHMMMLILGGLDKPLNIVYTMSQPDGSFEFETVLPYGTLPGEYEYMISSTSVAPVFYGSFNYEGRGLTEIYTETENFNVSPGVTFPYIIEMQSVVHMADKTIVIEYPDELVSLSDACIFTTAKEQSPVYIQELGINIKSVTDGRIEIELTDDFGRTKPVNTVVSAFEFKGVGEGVAEIVCTVTDGEVYNVEE